MTGQLLALCNAGPTLATASADEPVTVDAGARTISGLLVPYGPVGQTSQGRLQFSQGSLSWTDPRRVKLLVEHSQRDSVGYATELVDGPDGLRGTFHVPPGAAGDQVLADAASGVRDGLSVGVQLDDKTAKALRASAGAAVQARGQLRETSSVAVPAFDGARVDNVAAHTTDLVVSAWTDEPNRSEGTAMPCTLCGQDHAPSVTCPTPVPAATASAPVTPATAAPVATAAAPVPAPAAAPLALAGAAWHVATEPATYTLNGDGPSLVRDAYVARFDGDGEAASRLHRFNAELTAGNPASVMALAAVATTATDGPDSFVGPTTYRPDLLRQAIDRARPIITRLGTTPIRNAQPFTLPVEGEFSGVAEHVEGTAHAPEGTLTGGDATMTPKAVSGAYRLSRELIDQSNPALDRIALRAMVRDYRRVSEAKVVAALLAATAVPAATGVNTTMELRAALALAVGDDDLEMDELFASKSFLAAQLAEVDGNGRPMLTITPNASGRIVPGYTGAYVDNTELVRASSVAAGDAYAVQNDGVLLVESPVQTFRFDEVEGPGIVKLALWSYFGAAVIDASAVERYTVA